MLPQAVTYPTYRMQFRFLAAFVAFSSIVSTNLFAQSKQPQEQGLLWQITGNGLEEPSYLYGTMHVSEKVAFHLTDSFFVALESADLIALEQDPSTWMDEMMSSGFITQTLMRSSGRAGVRTSYYGGDNTWYDKAFEISLPGTSDLGAVLSYQPNMVNRLLYRLSGGNEDFEEHTYLDLFIFQSARKMGKPVVSLEDFVETMRLSFKASKAAADDVKNGKVSGYFGARKAFEGKNPDELLQDAYRRGNLAMIDSLTRILNPSEGYRDYFLYQRNRTMVTGMDSIMRKQSLFTGVGAAHLPGDQGVIAMLREMGYKVRAVRGKPTSKSRKRMDKLAETFLNMDGQLQFTPDSFCQLSAPTQLVSLPEARGWSESMSTEMVNGAYYMIGRYNTYAPLVNRSQVQLRNMVDSLLYEYIPGKILKQTSITEAGFPGFDITNQTVRGDVQRYRIVITPLQIIVFKVSASGEYFSGKTGDNVMASAHINLPKNTGWRTVQPSFGGFSVEMPGLHVNNELPEYFDDLAIDPQYQAYDAETGRYYLVKRTTLYDYLYIEEDTFDLAMLAKGFADQLDLEKESQTIQTDNGRPLLESVWKTKSGRKLHIQTRIQGPFYYLLVATGDERPARFFDSFSITPLRYSKPFSTQTDSTVLFSSACYAVDTTNKDLFEDLYKSGYSLYGEDDEEPPKAEEWDAEQILTTPAGEEVYVRVDKYHDYVGFESMEEFWEDWRENTRNDSLLAVVSHSETSDGPYPTLHVVVGDTNTIRTIHTHHIYKDGLVYRIVWLTDSLTETPPLATAIMNSFAPLDSNAARDVLEDKGAYFFEEYFSGDSARKADALEQFYKVEFEDRHFENMQRMVAQLGSDEEEFDYRKSLIRSMGQMKRADVLPYLENLYRQAGDTVELQMRVLRSIGWLRTKESSKAYVKLMAEELPLTDSPEEVALMLYAFNDSLELAQYLFPALLEYADYEEYKDPILDLLADFAAEGHAKPAMYGTYRNRLLRDARYELKRQKSRERSMQADARPLYEYSTRSYTSISNQKLLRYAKLLYPFKNEPEVAKWYQDAQHTKLQLFKYDIATQWMKLDIPQSDTIWPYLASIDRLRMDVYDFLKKEEKLDLLPDSAYTQDKVAWSMVYHHIEPEPEDSVSLVEKRLINQGTQQGYVYFYKRKDTDKDYWKIDYSGIQPADTTKFAPKAQEIDTSERVSSDETVEEVIDQLAKEIKYRHRKRMGFGRSYY